MSNYNKPSKRGFSDLFSPGRTHQLRIQSGAIGRGIFSCDLYASDEAFSLAPRLMLHAERIDFEHPLSGEKIKGFCPCPF